MAQKDPFPLEDIPFADVAALQKALRKIEDGGRKILGIQHRTDGATGVDEYEFDLFQDLNTPASGIMVEPVPPEAKASRDAYRAFIAPKLNAAEQVTRAIMVIGGRDVEVVVLRPAEEILLPSDRFLRGDGTWPWFAEIDGNDIVVRNAKTTAFGGTDDTQDSGETASGFPTKGNPNFKGCALPMRYEGLNEAVRKALGGSPIPKMDFGVFKDGKDNPAGAHVKVTHVASGKSIVVPVIDLGPAKQTGHPLDLTVAAAREFNPNATANNFSMRLELRILDGVRLGGLSLAAPPTSLVDEKGFPQRLARRATGQFDQFQQLHESQSPLREQIKRYWIETGFQFTSVAEAWSAVFVSWNVMKAGATTQEFEPKTRHSEFVHRAIAAAGDPAAAFVGRRIEEYSPKVGDILQNNRDGLQHDFEFAKVNRGYPSHSAIVVETGVAPNGQRFAMTIGGNENNGIRRRRVPLTPEGRVIQPEPEHFIAIVETRKA